MTFTSGLFHVVKTLRFPLPPDEAADASDLLEAATRIDGVHAALLGHGGVLQLLVSRHRSPLLVHEEMRQTLLALACTRAAA